MVGKVFFNLCLLLNIAALAAYTIAYSSPLFGFNTILEFFNSESILQIRSLITLFILALGIRCLILWSKNDRKPSTFFVLFFLMGIYSPFYYLKAKKRGWV